ncbi:MAG: SDR family oxidoreductase [Saccharospirillaceae bacterium]|nr:SDR family oxidoreductase [Pseudomonadales bacterium]NRB81187.1 SDR family oxidoreductase [Saccharospirillaceae bacterium]
MKTLPTKNVVIIGATSAIAKQVAKKYADSNNQLYLVARNQEQLNIIAQDCQVRTDQGVNTFIADLTDRTQINKMFEDIQDKLSSIDVLLVAHGTLPDQKNCEQDVDQTLRAIAENGLSVINILTIAANILEKQKSGNIAVISSVAGMRGRQSNYVYGCAKSMVSTFLQGLRNRLHKSGVYVTDIKPGFVDTPMTAHIEKKGALWASSEQVGQIIVESIQKNKQTVYAPFFWRYIMLIITSVPEFIFKKLSL